MIIAVARPACSTTRLMVTVRENKKKLTLLYIARSLRGIGDGFATLVLTAYLIEIGFSAFQIGVVSTAALLGTAVTTLIIGLIGPNTIYELSCSCARP